MEFFSLTENNISSKYVFPWSLASHWISKILLNVTCGAPVRRIGEAPSSEQEEWSYSYKECPSISSKAWITGKYQHVNHRQQRTWSEGLMASGSNILESPREGDKHSQRQKSADIVKACGRSRVTSLGCNPGQGRGEGVKKL